MESRKTRQQSKQDATQSVTAPSIASQGDADASNKNPLIVTFLGLAKEHADRKTVKRPAKRKNTTAAPRPSTATRRDVKKPVEEAPSQEVANPTSRRAIESIPSKASNQQESTLKVNIPIAIPVDNVKKQRQQKQTRKLRATRVTHLTSIEESGPQTPIVENRSTPLVNQELESSNQISSHPLGDPQTQAHSTIDDCELIGDMDDEDLLCLVQYDKHVPSISAVPRHNSEADLDYFSLAEQMADPLRRPITRPPPPKPARDRSPVAGLKVDEILRTCFRIGEALNNGCNAARVNRNLIIELYARVVCSTRHSEKPEQRFIFADLFHNRPPFIEGTYAGWKGVDLWEFDSAPFLGPNGRGRLCRCIARMKRDGVAWSLSIVSIWEVTWDDIDYVHGILTS